MYTHIPFSELPKDAQDRLTPKQKRAYQAAYENDNWARATKRPPNWRELTSYEQIVSDGSRMIAWGVVGFVVAVIALTVLLAVIAG